VVRWLSNRKAQQLERVRVAFVNAVDLATFEGVSESDIAHLAEVSPATLRRWHSGESTPHPAIFPFLTKRIIALADEHSKTKARKLKP
jgi:DNA-binding transcriptional regulator YiaG